MQLDLERSGPWIGVGGMAVATFLYGYTAIVLPSLETLLLLPLAWLVLTVLAVAWFTRHPYRSLAMPFLAIGLWFVAMLT
jgi:hypothetical protein